jgi:hypothetical protein
VHLQKPVRDLSKGKLIFSQLRVCFIFNLKITFTEWNVLFLQKGVCFIFEINLLSLHRIYFKFILRIVFKKESMFHIRSTTRERLLQTLGRAQRTIKYYIASVRMQVENIWKYFLFAISTFYLVELWHFKNCNYCNTFSFFLISQRKL